MAVHAEEASLGRMLLHVAWLAIVLGIVIQLVLLVVASLAGTAPTTDRFVAELARKISWKTIVCTGASVGRAATTAERVAARK